MSAADDGRDDAPAPKDPREPLTQREVIELFLRDPALRPYVFAALGSLAMVFLVMFLGGSDIGGVVVVLFGLATLLFRWTAGPPVLLLILFYFQLFPFAIPDPDMLYDNPLEVRQTHFRVADVILVTAILVYFRSAYRLFGLLHQSMPFEGPLRRRGERPTRRPLSHIGPGEVAWMVGGAAALVVVGQIAWWLLNAVEFVPADGGFPLRWADADSLARYRRTAREPGEFTAGQNRFFVTVGVLFFGLLACRLVFGYWRLRATGAAEGAMLLADTSWSETHRERSRLEKWRVWARDRAKEQARKEARADRERREKEEAARAKAERAARGRARRRPERGDDDRPRRPWA